MNGRWIDQATIERRRTGRKRAELRNTEKVMVR